MQLFISDAYKTYRDYTKWRIDSRNALIPKKLGPGGELPYKETDILSNFAIYLNGYLLEISELQKTGKSLRSIKELPGEGGI